MREKEAIGKNTLELYRYPDEYEKQGRLRFNPEAKEDYGLFELENIRKNGEVFFTENVGTPLRDRHGRITGFLSIIRDISERLETEKKIKEKDQRIESVFRVAPAGIGLAQDRILQEVNNFLCQMTGYSKEELIGKDARMFYLSDEDYEMVGGEKRRLIQENSTGSIEVPWKKKDGSVIYVVHSCTPLDVNDLSKGEIVTTVDITKHKQVEKEVLDLLKEKELLLREVHHRIKNNMNTVISLLKLQADSVKNIEAKDSLLNAQNRIRSMQVLYDILYRSENFDVTWTELYMNSLIDEIYRNLTQRQKVSIERVIADFEISARMIFTLGIILNELITNAMKHAFEGKDRGRIDISLSREGKMAKLKVMDNGTGLPSSVDLATHSGFGLSLVRELSSQIGGQLTVERKRGTSFILEFEVD